MKTTGYIISGIIVVFVIVKIITKTLKNEIDKNLEGLELSYDNEENEIGITDSKSFTFPLVEDSFFSIIYNNQYKVKLLFPKIMDKLTKFENEVLVGRTKDSIYHGVFELRYFDITNQPSFDRELYVSNFNGEILRNEFLNTDTLKILYVKSILNSNLDGELVWYHSVYDIGDSSFQFNITISQKYSIEFDSELEKCVKSLRKF